MTDITAAMQEGVKGLFPELLGIQFVKTEPEGVRAELTVRKELCTVPGIMTEAQSWDLRTRLAPLRLPSICRHHDN